MTREEEVEAAWQQHRASHRPLRTVELRERLAEAQNWRCCYCGCEMAQDWRDPRGVTFEHVISLSDGGADEVENLVIVCWTCNNRRGNANMLENTYAHIGKYSWHINSVIPNRGTYKR